MVSSAVLTLGALPASAASPPEDLRISETASWVLKSDDEWRLSELERTYGLDPQALEGIEPFWQDGMLFTPDGLAESILAQVGLDPVRAMNYEPTVGILYVEMNGVTLSPFCGNGEVANAARNCTPLVSQQTSFPAYGNGSQQSSVFQQLRNYYDPFNIVMTTSRPPDWVPYTMAVIGGSAGQAGLGGGVCGVANVACDGLKRNHVSLTFPNSCGGVAETAAQETSHNWGLEHTNNTQDLLYPFNNGGSKSFVDSCMAISHATGAGITQCGYIHEIYCPAGGGEQQNSYAELMGVFGPREVDDIAPEIISTTPENGAVVGTDASFTVSAKVSENGRFLAAKWTFLEGLPEGVDSFTRCTNKVCDDDYNFGVGFDPNAADYPFLQFSPPIPPGVYSMQFEVMDAYGNYDSKTISFEVSEDGSATGNGSDTADDGGDGGTESGDDGSEGEGDGTDSVGASGLTGADGGDDGGGKDGCACRASSTAHAWAAWSLLGLALMTTRRRP